MWPGIPFSPLNYYLTIFDAMEPQQNSLLKNYSLPERGAYLGALATMALADGNVSAQELEFLDLVSQAAELPPTMQQEVRQIANDPSQVSMQKCLDVLKGSQLRFSFITDVISLAKADGQYAAQEQQRMEEMAAYLQVSQEQFSILNQFVNKAGEAQQQGEDPTSSAFLTKSGFGDLFKNVNISPQMVQGVLGVVTPLVLGKMLGSGYKRGQQKGLGGLLGRLAGGTVSQGSGGLGSFIAMLGGVSGRQKHGGLSSGGLGGLLKNIIGGSRFR